MKNNDINIKEIWKKLRSEKGKGISFFAFYTFFFIFLFILMTSPGHKAETNLIEENPFPFSIKDIEEKDYNFKVIMTKNSEEALYTGTKENSEVVLKDDRGLYTYYYQNGNLIYLNGVSEIKYSQLFDIYEIKKLIKNSKLTSETKITATNEYIYTYDIGNDILSDALNLEITNKDLVNQIEVIASEDKKVKAIIFDITKLINEIEKVDLFKINIVYGDSSEENSVS